jgi:DNA repair exonuclease SbcCD ATPase subunit
MKIIKLEAENIKKLKAIEIIPDPDNPLVVIGGKNAQGKTSVLDAISWAIGGKRLAQEKPIRKGQKSARVEVNLGDLIIERKWTEGGNSTLKVRSKDGARYDSPQTMLDEMLGTISFDPLAFARMSPKARVEVLLGVAGVDIDLDELARQRQKLYDKRTAVGREGKRLDGLIASAPELEEGRTFPDKEVSVTDLADELTAATEAAGAKDSKGNDCRNLEADHKRMLDRKATLESDLEEIEAGITRILGKLDAEKDALKKIKVPDIEEIRERLNGVETLNWEIRERQQQLELKSELDEAKSGWKTLTDKIDAADEKKRSALADADLPIDGLELGEDDVLYNDIPFDQTSAAEQLRVSLAMAMAANPKLQVIRISDGSLLDDDNMALIAEMAGAEGYQVWIERVGTDGNVGVVIEDGEVVGAP